MENKVTLPVIHTNGTSANMLFTDYSEALHSLREARSKISKVEFHSRDYYPNDTWEAAKLERTNLFIKLAQIESELVQIQEHVAKFIKT